MKHIYHNHNNDVQIKGLNLTASDAELEIYYFLWDVISENDLDAEIYMVYAHGSRLFGNPLKSSDLDFVVFYTGTIHEDGLFNIFCEEDYTINGVKCDFNPIRLFDSVHQSFDEQINRYIEKHDNVLQEDAAYALSDGNNQTSAFSYEIKPLNTNLSQPGNDIAPMNRNDSFKFFIGDIVKGYCPYDKKYHKGMIKYLYFTHEHEKVPKYVYVQDFTTEDTIALDAETVEKFNSIPDMQFREYRTQYDSFQYRPVIEKLMNAVSTGIQKGLSPQ